MFASLTAACNFFLLKSPEPHVEKVGRVTRAQLEDIATTKLPDLTAKDMDAAVRTIAGSARSAGIETEGVV